MGTVEGLFRCLSALCCNDLLRFISSFLCSIARFSFAFSLCCACNSPFILVCAARSFSISSWRAEAAVCAFFQMPHSSVKRAFSASRIGSFLRIISSSSRILAACSRRWRSASCLASCSCRACVMPLVATAARGAAGDGAPADGELLLGCCGDARDCGDAADGAAARGAGEDWRLVAAADGLLARGGRGDEGRALRAPLLVAVRASGAAEGDFDGCVGGEVEPVGRADAAGVGMRRKMK